MADRSNLPAPYESPWLQLGRALQAVAASLRLDGRSLWRRNIAGELAVPRFWPRTLAPVFWPLAAALALALAVTLVAWLGATLRPGQPDVSAPAAEPAPRVLIDQAAASSEATTTPAAADVQPEQVSPDQPVEAEATPDPLLKQFNEGLDPGLIRAADPQPARAALQLRLAPAFEQLDPGRQRRLAEAWLERSLDLGFEQLELINDQGQSVGHRARVGSGMILLDPAATS